MSSFGPSDAPRDAIEVGRVGRPHGLRGAVTVQLHDPCSTAFERARPGELGLRLADGAWRSGLRVVGQAGASSRILAIDGVTGRDQAETLRGAAVWVARRALALAPGEVLFVDLVGCRVHEGSAAYGEVVEVFEAGAAAVLVVRQGADERMVPYAEGTVGAIDLEAKTIELIDGEQWPVQPAQDPAEGRPWRGGSRRR
ncbi:MAG: 16S rRNA processing protein RimM [Proteobacteria bacterium]|nr:16S rRNA processing protein RimM [Pseudomonadota bacterium]